MSSDITQTLYSAGISIGTYGLYKFFQNLYHKYYLKSECHTRSLEIVIVDREETKVDCKVPEIELTNK